MISQPITKSRFSFRTCESNSSLPYSLSIVSTSLLHFFRVTSAKIGIFFNFLLNDVAHPGHFRKVHCHKQSGCGFPH